MGRWRHRNSLPPASPSIDWVLQGELAIGPAPRSDFLPHLLGRRIQVILSLCSEMERPLPKELSDRFRCVRAPLPDSHYARIMEVEELAEAVDILHWNLLKRRPVYIHCLAGIERSPLVCVAYLCRYRQMDLLEALNWMAHVHPPTRPKKTQIQVVQHYLNHAPHSFNYDLRL